MHAHFRRRSWVRLFPFHPGTKTPAQHVYATKARLSSRRYQGGASAPERLKGPRKTNIEE